MTQLNSNKKVFIYNKISICKIYAKRQCKPMQNLVNIPKSCKFKIPLNFTARCYGNMKQAVALCPSVCLSQSCTKMDTMCNQANNAIQQPRNYSLLLPKIRMKSQC